MSDKTTITEQLPRHIAIVMDGNGRWAERRGERRNAGHRAGVNATRRIVEACGQLGIDALTLFAFSSENWQRPPSEVGMLMALFIEALGREVKSLHEKNVRLQFIGERSLLSEKLQRKMSDSELLTAANGGLQLYVAVSYGGRWDITNAARRLVEEVAHSGLTPGQVTEERLHQCLALAAVKDPDLFIRTGGEHRISNFLLWNLAYTELYFTDALWPDFGPADLELAVREYQQRQRRYGRVPQQHEEPG
ncbi:MAG: di-trans,poly-cis-decaprenylcistransferase [Gammaproteobacteria bacterium]|nr:di-trans,poly-cis-decaprenylcistransferase [Gammaproteobacteria bacterium]